MKLFTPAQIKSLKNRARKLRREIERLENSVSDHGDKVEDRLHDLFYMIEENKKFAKRDALRKRQCAEYKKLDRYLTVINQIQIGG